MKHVTWAALAAILMVLLALPPLTASAEEVRPLVVDDADILSYGDEVQLTRLLERIGAEQKCEIVVVTVSETKGKSAQTYADDYFDENGYGYGAGDDGILFLIHMGRKDREWAISTHGLGHRALGDEALDGLEDRVVPYLSEEQYYRGVQVFVEGCEFYLRYYDDPDSVDNDSVWMTYLENDVNVGFLLLIAVAMGAVIAFLVVNGMKAQLTSVRSRDEAGDYVRPDSFHLTRHHDVFLYHTVTRIRRDTESGSSGGSHRSSSGRTHGGRSGRF